MTSCPMCLQGFELGDDVFLINPRAVRHKVATGNISGVHGEHKFHGKEIPESWFKVNVNEVLEEGVALMYPHEAADMTLIQHAKGSSALWSAKYIKHASAS